MTQLVEDRLKSLSPEKRAMLQALLKKKAREKAASEAGRQGRRNRFPLSFAQERLWFLSQLEPGNPLYNLPLSIRLRGELDVQALERALGALAQRHEVLRTAFVPGESGPRQEVLPFLLWGLSVVDVAAEDGDGHARSLMAQQSRQPFDLTEAPLFRACLFRLKPRQYVFHLTMHHIVTDGWSHAILTRELTYFYRAYLEGKNASLEPLRIQYADFSQWQRSYLTGPRLENMLAFWKARLGRGDAVLELPTDRPRPPVKTYGGARFSHRIPEAASRRLQALSNASGVSLYMTLLAAFHALLHRYSGQTDIRVGTPIANRNRSDLEGMLGFFVNTLVLRAEPKGERAFAAFLKEVRTAVLEAHEHQDLPFERLVQEIQPERQPQLTPLFQVMFSLQNAPRSRVRLPGLELGLFELGTGRAKFDLSLNVTEFSDGLSTSFEYNTDLFDAVTIQRFQRHYRLVLETVAEAPETRIDALPLMSEAERHQILVAWNETALVAPVRDDILGVIADRARAAPDRPALTFENRMLTNDAVMRRTRSLGGWLRTRGGEGESPVAICMDRSPDAVVAMLAALHAGLPFLPLNPADPDPRLGIILTESNAGWVLTQPSHARRLEPVSATGGTRLLVLDEKAPPAEAAEETARKEVHPQALAYVLFTSGSTGRPKGVAVSHASLSRYLTWSRELFQGKAMGELPLVSALSFDASLKQSLGVLFAGRPVRVLADRTVADPILLAAALRRWVRTALNCVPALWRNLLASIESGEAAFPPACLTDLFLGGEALNASLLDETRARFPELRVWNLYGPTETTVNATASLLSPATGISIGRPIDGACGLVLDSGLRLLPVGVPGELHIGGSSTARGYLHRPELTAAAFVPDPFRLEPGARLYKSGDRVRLLNDGRLAYLGRIDFQVKLRGFRIELGEIESVLTGHPEVGEAAVLIHEDRLIGFVAGSRDAEFESEARSFLERRLPAYMIPARIAVLTELPRTPHGKIDRAALVRQIPAQAETEDSLAEAGTEIERLIRGIWEEVLAVARVNLHDNFFALGGHSLLATRVIARINRVCRTELPLRVLFEAPTVAALARRISSRGRRGTRPVPPIQALARPDRVPLSFAQQRLWLIDRMDPGAPVYNVPVAERMSGPIDMRIVEGVLNALASRHEVLRTFYPQGEDGPFQKVLPYEPVPLDVVDLAHLSNREREATARHLTAAHAVFRFRLDLEPPVRRHLLKLDNRRFTLLLNLHHIATDAWANRTLRDEFRRLFLALRHGLPSPLEPLPFQYADFALWQRRHLDGPILDAQKEYWLRQLGVDAPPLALPTDKPRPARRSARGGRIGLALPARLGEALKELARNRSATPFMLYLAAAQVLLARYSHQREIRVGTPVAGRKEVEAERLIGFFVNTLVIRGDLSANPSFSAFLDQVRDRVLDAFDNGDLPFQDVVELVETERNLSRSPVFQAMFQYVEKEAGGRGSDRETEDRGTSAPVQVKFDLNIVVAEHRQAGHAGRRLAIQDREDPFEADTAAAISHGSGSLVFEYAGDLFEATTVQRLARRFETLLRAVAANPQTRVLDLPLLSHAERALILHQWQTPLSQEEEPTFPARFAAQAVRTPDCTALWFQDRSLTYRALKARVANLARGLNALGVGPGKLVGLCMARSLEQMVGLLAILEAGGAYLPLDPRFPAERLTYMVEDSGAARVLTDEASWRALSKTAPTRAQPIYFKDLSAREDTSTVPPCLFQDDLAYAIYTSGSTGQPKGALLSHRSLGNLVRAQRELLGVGPDGRILQFASLSFDASVWEISMTLGFGACLLLVNHQPPLVGDALSDFLQTHAVTHFTLPPTVLSDLDAARIAAVASLIVAGEPCPPELTMRFAAGRRFINAYGPTEASVCATAAICRASEDHPPIGRPIANVKVLPLDAGLSLVPIGALGELHIGGPSVGRGYHRRPNLTAERFVPDPFAGEPGARLYKTGDWCRFLADGNIAYQGRMDHQIKLRGYRIELVEIENALARFPGVEACAVVVRGDGGLERLAAFWVGEAEDSGFGNPREFLKRTIPDYMVPATVTRLDRFPLTPQGKIDRAALVRMPLAEPSDREVSSETDAASKPVDLLLASLWREVLGRHRIRPHDHFFELGGHSLLAAKLVARIHDAFGVDLPLRALFEQPTLAGLSAEVMRALGAESLDAQPPPVPLPHHAEPVLSFAQERLWFIDSMDPGSPVYNVPMAEPMPGPLATAELERALRALIGRHAILRTRYPSIEGRPRPLVSEDEPFRLTVVDTSSLPKGPAREQIETLARHVFHVRFDLACGPLFRACLARSGPGLSPFLLNIHHIATDGWSADILRRELKALYHAFAHRLPLPLPPPVLQYADYAQWQRSLWDSRAYSGQLAYWREQLAGPVPTLELPEDHASAQPSGTGGNVRLVLDPALTQALRDFALARTSTVFMAVLTVFQELLFRYSHQRDFAIGTPVSGRNRVVLEDVVGMFANTLVLRADLSGDPNTDRVLERVKRTVLSAFANGDVPFEKLVEELQPERSLAHSPLFRTMFAYRESDGAVRRETGSGELAGFDAAKFDLTLSATHDTRGLDLVFNYRKDLFERSTVVRMAGHFERLARSAMANPEHSVSRLDLLGPGERHQLLQAWNETEMRLEYPEEGPGLLALFRARVRHGPEAIALVGEDRFITYADLASRSDRLARRLAAYGARPDRLIGIFAERSPEMVIAVLAVLAAGAAYLPLDPEWPERRLAAVLAESRPPAVLAQPGLEARLPPLPAGAALYPLADLEREDETIPARPLVSPEALAYAMYTSGSTGRPKAVMVGHRAICNRLLWMEQVFPLRPDDRVLQKTSLGFDPSVWELFGTLMAGAQVVLARPDGQRDAAYLVETMRRQKINLLALTPALLLMLLETPGFARCRDLRLITCGGEALTPSLLRRFRKAFAIPLWNFYGPTEACIDTTYYPCRAGERPVVPIGKPIGNMRIHLLDKWGRPVPVGVGGELHIGGIGLARGYFQRPAMSADRFVPDPYGPSPGARLYRSGDLARTLTNGEIVFSGRVDDQVKLRGFRIEPGDIEAQLQKHPSVREAAVVVREERGTKHLVAYLTVRSGYPADAGEVKAFLGKRIPGYMMPNAVVFLENLPHNVNGKIDRNALRGSAYAPRSAAGETAAPRRPGEEVLAGIWQNLLGLERVGIHDGFFELGGHSLLATQLVSRIRDVFRVALSVRAVFEKPTIAELAEAIEKARAGGPVPESNPTPVPRGGALPLSFAQQRLWFIEQLNPGSAAYHVPLAETIEGPLDTEKLAASLGNIVRRHEVLRTCFPARRGRPVQNVLAPFPVALPLIDLSGLSHEALDRGARNLAGRHAGLGFDLAAGPLFRCMLLRLKPERHVLAINQHHIVTDGWSNDLFRQELSIVYRALIQDRPAALPPLPIQYADFAAWQREWLRGEVPRAQLAYWKRKLGDPSEVLELAYDKPRPAKPSALGGVVRFEIPEAAAHCLRTVARDRSATPFMVLAAAFQVFLARYSGQETVRVGTPVAGRTRTEIEPLIGFFVNTLVLRGSLRGNPSFQSFLEQSRDTVLEAHAHQEIPFEKLVDELQPERELGRTPLFQVWFTYTDASQRAKDRSRAGDSAAFGRPFAFDFASVKFDLSLEAVHRQTGIGLAFRYRQDLFEPETVARMAEVFANLLETIGRQPEQRVFDLELLPDALKHRIFAEWNRSERVEPHPPVPQLFSSQERRTPDAVALQYEEGRCQRSRSYTALNARAENLAHRLRTLGVGPETFVALYLDSAPETITAMLAVLKTGAAYLVLDPNLSRERLAFMIGDAKPGALLTNRARAGSFSRYRGIELYPEDLSTEPNPRAFQSQRARSEHAAYLIFTSGSTGRPKAVVVAHRALGNYALAVGQRLGPLAGMSFALVSSLAVDLGLTAVYPSLIAGGRLHPLTREQASDPSLFAAYFACHRIDALKIVPSHLAALQEITPTMPRKLLVLGGEAADADWLDRLRKHAPECRVLNHYGPTESTVGMLTHALETTAAAKGVPPLGKPLANTRAHVLDPRLRPLPPGAAGELHIGGMGLARGYLNAPDLTAKSFVPNPHEERVPGTRLYKTGDRARYRHDGAVVFLGRIDFQVKLRGYRIEPGEIAAVLREVPGIRDTVVLLQENAAGEKRWVAYLAGETGSADAVRDHLARRLPEYMIPEDLVFLARLPRNASGKVDRGKLARVPSDRDDGNEPDAFADERPANQVQAMLAAIWESLLGRTVGIHRNFFSLGGHSLLAARAAARIREALGVALPVSAIFEMPTIARLEGEIHRYRTGKEEPLPPLVRVSGTGPRPLSFAQQRLWFIDRMEPGTPIYNVPYAQPMKMALDAAALERALDGIHRRHEVLRTRYPEVRGRPALETIPAFRLSLPLIDLSGLPPVRAHDLARQQSLSQLHFRFDLRTGPLSRWRVLRFTDDDHLLLGILHHLVTDGLSREILRTELRAFYRAFLNGEHDPLPSLDIQYADYASWQKQWFRGEVVQRQIDYWRRALGDELPVLELPLDRPRPTLISLAGARAGTCLPTGPTARLLEFARSRDCTLFMALMAAMQTWLARYAQQDEVCVGMPVSGRHHPAAEKLIGFFVNTLVIRGDLSGDPSFGVLLVRTRDRVLGAVANQDLPFEKLVEIIKQERDTSRTPLFQVMFNYAETSGTGPARFGDALRAAGVEPRVEVPVKMDLTLNAVLRGDALDLVAEYRTSLFDETTIRRMLGHFRRILQQIPGHAERRLSDFEVLAETEKHQLLSEWAGGEGRKTPQPFPKWFDGPVARTPHAVALNMDGNHLTYGCLRHRAAVTAGTLTRLGLGRERLAAIRLPPSIDRIVAMVAVLGAGGVFLPLDHECPPDRLGFMMEDSRAQLLICDGRTRTHVPAPNPRRYQTVALEPLSAEARTGPVWIQDAPGDQLAYVIYTSGSTGRPKGAQCTHRGWANLIETQTELFRIGPTSRLLQFAAFSFDASVSEIGTSLAAGATLLMGKRASLMPGPELAVWLRSRTVTHVTLPPSALTLMENASMPSLETLVVAGEACPPQLAAAFGHKTRFLNAYGPTETTVCATAVRLFGQEPQPPIGRPLDRVRTYLLDKAMTPLAAGCLGELYVGGIGVGRGYRRRPARTARTFLPDPWIDTPGARLYKTGDLARFRTDGKLVFHGRRDHQVKWRGCRIEPGEIEAQLCQHPAVARACVVLREDRAGDPRLVAYIEAAITGKDLETEKVQPDPRTLRRHLERTLPAYMMPSHFMTVSALPLTASGKIDKKALPRPREASATTASGYPRNNAEWALTRIWERLLGVTRIGIHDNFFELGGHSLLAVRLMGRIEERFGVLLPVSVIFEKQTVASLAGTLHRTRVKPQVMVRISAGGKRMPFHWVHPVGGNAFCYVDLARAMDRGRPIFAFQAPGLEEDVPPLASVEDLAARYLEAMRERQPHGPYAFGGWSMGGLVAFEMARRLRERGEEVAALALIDCPAPDPDEEMHVPEDRALWAFLARDLGGLFGKSTDRGTRTTDVDVLRRQIAEILPSSTDRGRLERIFRVYKANVQAASRYLPGPYGGSAVVFRAMAVRRADESPAMGWERWVGDGLVVHDLPCGHYEIIREPHVRELVKRLDEALPDRA